jgi:two-component system, OmpR family, manganese sensing sensor histidine kinase
MKSANFTKTRQRLLFSYLGVLASILTVFAIAVRIVYIRSLQNQIIDGLSRLAELAASEAKIENGQFKIDVDTDTPVKDIIINSQTIQWFNQKRQLINTYGKLNVSLPLHIKNERIKIQAGTPEIVVVTLSVFGKDRRHLLGYIRASQSLEEMNENLHKLDLGLGIGIFVALILSGGSGIWLTKQTMRPIEEGFERLRQFTADASHELRNPLTAIKSNAAVALKYGEGMRTSDREKFEAIASATNQITQLTEDLLLLARADQVPDRSHGRVNLSTILIDLIQLYTLQSEVKSIIINSQLQESVYIIGDMNQLTRLFSNLLTNALRYTPDGGRVEVELRSISKSIIVDVRDTGIGIATEHLTRIFDRFWQVDQVRSYEIGSGLGLGLAIAGAIALSHNGEITVASELNCGSCFTVSFSSLG